MEQIDTAFHTVGLAVTTIGGALSLVATIYYGSVRFARVEFQVQTMWDFIMRRGMVEALNKGVLQMNSPITVTPEAARWFDPMAEDLRKWWQAEGRSLDQRNQFIMVESRFGDRIMMEVCLPQKLNVGACIWAALEIAKAGDPKRDSDRPADTKVER